MTQIIIKPPDGQPIVGDNIQLVWSGQYDGMGKLIQLDSLTITYDDPKPEEPMRVIGCEEPHIFRSETKKYWIVWYRWAKGSRQFYGDSREEAIHEANEYIKTHKGIA